MQEAILISVSPDGSISRSVSPTEEVAPGAISGIGFAYSLDEGTTWAAAANADETTANLFRYGTREVTPAVTSSETLRRPKANHSTIGSRLRAIQLISGLTTFLPG